MGERPDYLRPYHAERIITAGRLLLALFLVVAVLLDSTEPIRYARLIQRVSVIYAVYAAAIAALTWARRTTISGLALVTHIADLVLFSVLMHFTVAPSSPFSMYLVFAIVCAAVRWHGRGALPADAEREGLFAAGRSCPRLPAGKGPGGVQQRRQHHRPYRYGQEKLVQIGR